MMEYFMILRHSIKIVVVVSLRYSFLIHLPVFFIFIIFTIVPFIRSCRVSAAVDMFNFNQISLSGVKITVTVL